MKFNFFLYFVMLVFFCQAQIIPDTIKEQGIKDIKIIPVFTTYTTLMLKSLVSKPYKSVKRIKKVKHIKVLIVIITFISLPVYILSMSLIIILAAQGKIESAKLQIYVGGVEIGFGAYIGAIISTLFIEKR